MRPLVALCLCLWLPGSELLLVVGEGDQAERAAAAARLRLVDAGHRVSPLPAGGGLPAGAGLVLAVGRSACRRLDVAPPSGLPVVRCVEDAADAGAGHAVVPEPPDPALAGLVTRLLPRARRIGILAREGTGTAGRRVEGLRRSLADGYEVRPLELAAGGGGLERVWDARLEALVLDAELDACGAATVRAILLGGLRRNLPVIGHAATVVRAGALAAVDATPESLGRAGADLAIEILADPASAPRRREAPAECSINLAVAGRLWIVVPADLRAAATQLFGSDPR